MLRRPNGVSFLIAASSRVSREGPHVDWISRRANRIFPKSRRPRYNRTVRLLCLPSSAQTTAHCVATREVPWLRHYFDSRKHWCRLLICTVSFRLRETLPLGFFFPCPFYSSNNGSLSIHECFFFFFALSGGSGQHGSKSHRHRPTAHPEPVLLPDQPAGGWTCGLQSCRRKLTLRRSLHKIRQLV